MCVLPGPPWTALPQQRVLICQCASTEVFWRQQNIPVISLLVNIVVCKDFKKVFPFVSYIHTYLSYIQTLLLIYQALKQRKLNFERDLWMSSTRPCSEMHLSWNKHITSSSLDNQHKIFMKNKILLWHPLIAVPLTVPFLLKKIQWY